MTFNKFIDKALTAAKKSIIQIYGDDYSGIKNNLQDDETDNSNKKYAENQLTYSRNGHQRTPKQQKKTARSPKQHENFDAKLKSIRKYAAQQINLSLDEITQWNSSLKENATDSSGSSMQLYSRKDLQSSAPKSKNKNKPQQNTGSGEASQQINQVVDRFISEDDRQPEKDEGSNSDLHDRLDRLESLMHLTLSSSDSEFSGHPLFHKLLQKDVPAKIINSWFNKIVEQGINPNKQKALFRSKLALVIQDLLENSTAGPPSKNLLFTGRSGAGKTTLIMKLSRASKFMGGKNIAIASLAPQKVSKHRYSMLGPFCKDHDISYWDLKKADEFEQYFSEWEKYDHVLIDTPFLEGNNDNLVTEILTLQDKIKTYSSIETHYLINTAVSSIAFGDPLQSEIKANYIALTKIDKATQWGKAVQLISNTDCKIRYISNGASITGSIIPFDPQKSAERLIH